MSGIWFRLQWELSSFCYMPRIVHPSLAPICLNVLLHLAESINSLLILRPTSITTWLPHPPQSLLPPKSLGLGSLPSARLPSFWSRNSKLTIVSSLIHNNRTQNSTLLATLSLLLKPSAPMPIEGKLTNSPTHLLVRGASLPNSTVRCTNLSTVPPKARRRNTHPTYHPIILSSFHSNISTAQTIMPVSYTGSSKSTRIRRLGSRGSHLWRCSPFQLSSYGPATTCCSNGLPWPS